MTNYKDLNPKKKILEMTPEEHLDAAIGYAEAGLIKDTKKRTAMRHKEQEVESFYIWIALPVLLVGWIIIRWIIG